ASITVPDGAYSATFYVQALRGATGGTTVTARSTRAAPHTASVEIVTPIVRLEQIATNRITSNVSTLSDDGFKVTVAIPKLGGGGLYFQGASAAEAPLPLTLTRTGDAIADVFIGAGTPAASVTYQLA